MKGKVGLFVEVCLIYVYRKTSCDSDLYTFDADDASAKETYGKVCEVYEKIFKKLELPIVKGIVMIFVKVFLLRVA